jgi:hypothetical protein
MLASWSIYALFVHFLLVIKKLEDKAEQADKLLITTESVLDFVSFCMPLSMIFAFFLHVLCMAASSP